MDVERAGDGAGRDRSTQSWFRRARRFPVLVLLISLSATYLVWQNARHNAMHVLQTEFDLRAHDVANRLARRMQYYEQVLHSTRAFLINQHEVERGEFQGFIAALAMDQNFPGIQGVSFAPLISEAQKEAHTRSVRKQGVGGYVVKPGGKRGQYAPVTFIEPFVGHNQGVLGFDNFSDPLRKANIESARDLDRAVVSDKLTLVQDAGHESQPGFLMFLPVYRSGHPHATVPERRRNIAGWLAASFRVNDLVAGMASAVAGEFDIRLYDGSQAAPAGLMYGAAGQASSLSLFSESIPIDVAGHHWLMTVRSLPAFERRLGDFRTQETAFVGGLISLLLALLTWLLARDRAHALQRAGDTQRELVATRRLQDALTASEERWKLALEAAGHGVWDCDLRAGEVEYSDLYLRMLGYSRADYPTDDRGWATLIHLDDRERALMAYQAHLDGETQAFAAEYRILCKDGQWKWVVSSGMVVERDAQGRALRMIGTHTDISDRIAMKSALSLSEAKLRAVVDNAPIGIWLVGVDGRYHFVNRSFCDSVGIPESAFLRADKLSDVMAAEEAAACTRSDRECLTGDGLTISYETLTFADGKPHQLEIRKVPFRDARGEAAGVVGTAVDVTEQLAREDALRDSEEKYRALVESALSIILRWDRAGNIVFINRYAEELFGYRQNELIGRHVVGTIVPEVESTHRDLSRLMDDILAHPEKYQLNINENIKKNGERLWVMWTNRPILDKSGKIMEVLSVGYDITDRMRAEEALRESEERYRELFDFANEFIVTTDVELAITSVNHMVVDALGYSRGEMLGSNIGEFVTAESLEKARNMLAKKLDGESPVTRYEISLRAKDGREIPCEFSTRIMFKDGAPAGIHAIGHDISERLRYEQALRESEADYRSIFTSARDFIFTIDTSNRVTSITHYFYEVTGYAEAEVIGAHIGKILTPESVDKAQRMIAAKLRGEHVATTYEVEVIAQDGRIIPVELNSTLRYKNGKLAGSQGIGRDITERRSYEQALRESEEKYRGLFENAGDFAYSTDLAGNFTAISDILLAATGFDRRELTSVAQLLTSEDLALSQKMTAAKLQNANHATRYELQLITKQGTTIPVEIVSTLIYRDGQPVGTQGIGRDITERKRAEEALRRSESNYRDLMEQAGDAIFVADHEGLRYLHVNHAACELLGYSREELLGFGPRSIVWPDDTSRNPAIWDEIWSGKTVQMERALRHKSGHPILVEMSVRMLSDGRLLSIKHDISKRRAREVALREANAKAEAASRAKSEFLANMSHEIRTPMNSVIGMARLALGHETDARQRGYLEKILMSGEHLLGIVDDILDFSKIEAGKLKTEKIDFDLFGLMENLAGLMAEKAVAKGLRFLLDIEPTLLRNVRGDPLRVRQILFNYIDNAIKFTSTGEVAVRAIQLEENTAGTLVHFEVRDTGIGMSIEDSSRLFQPFQQSDGSTTRRYGGTGLGLAICKRLAEIMGGEVGIESEPGRGSTFWFRVRLENGQAGDAAGVASLASGKISQALCGARILLAENNAFNQQVAREFLEAASCAVCVVNNGQEVLDALARQTFDCVLMDLQMPVMDGLEATRQIRSRAALSGLPVIAMTANALYEERERCLAAGMNDFISKPVLPEMLYSVLARQLQRQEPHDIGAPDAGVKQGEAWPTLADIDLSVLAEAIGGDGVRLREFAKRFVSSARQDMARVELALGKQDLQALRELGHHIKSPARMVGALPFAELCEALERNQQGLERAREIVAELGILLRRIEAQVASLD